MTTKLNWLLLCFTAIFAFCFTSCKDDEEEYSADYLLAIAEEDMNISVDAETTSYEIELTARAIWKATVTAGNEDGWLTLENDGDTGGVNTLSFSMEENTTGATRTATITITCHTAQKEITVTQSGSDLMIMDESEIEDRLDGHAAQRRAMVVVPLEAERTLLRVLGSGLWRRPQCRNRSGEHAGGHR